MKLRPKKTVIGTATCHCCGRDIPVKESETGTLDFSCQWCDLPMYSKPGTESHRILKDRVKRFEAVETTPEMTPKATPMIPQPAVPLAPGPRAARSVFDVLGGRE